ncbi:MAG: BatD family protein [Nitrospirota bacterium]
MKKILSVFIFALALVLPAASKGAQGGQGGQNVQGPVGQPQPVNRSQGGPEYRLSLEAKASRGEVAKGETFSYTLSVIEEGEADVPFRLSTPDFSGFNVTGKYSSQSTRIINNKERTVTEAEYRLSSDLAGEHLIPPAKAVVADPKTGKEVDFRSNPVKVTVTEHGPGILKGLGNDIRDIKGPMSFLERIKMFFYIITALVVLGFILVVGLIIYMARRGKKKRPVVPVAPAAPQIGPKEEALKALDAAEVLKSDSKVYYSVISEAIRRYMRAAHNIPATEATTAEIMEAVKSSTIPPNLYDKLSEVLEEADLVKFAKYVPGEDEKAKYMEKARNLIRSM